MRRGTPAKILLAAALLLVSTLLAACGGGARSTENYAPAPATAPEAAYAEDATTEMGDYAGGPGGGPTLTVPQDDRKVVLHAYLTVETLAFDKTCDALQQAATEAGGYVAATTLSGSAEAGGRSANFTFRIPADKYAGFIQAADEAGNMVSRSESSEDVTAQYVDIEARLSSLRTQEQRLLELMEESGSLEELLMVQEQLTQVQYEIESYQAMQRTLGNQIAYSTVEVYVYEVKQISELPPDTYFTRLQRAFAQSWRNALRFFEELSIGLVFLLPLLLILGVIALVVVLLVRRARRRKAERLAKNPPPAPPQPPQPPRYAPYGAPYPAPYPYPYSGQPSGQPFAAPNIGQPPVVPNLGGAQPAGPVPPAEPPATGQEDAGQVAGRPADEGGAEGDPASSQEPVKEPDANNRG